ncbi:hypothetical protein T8T21_16090 (plasmid) [Limimaricola variabilis]|uniref:hypothetical protein n=1 Tax=Limimaricola variabilis TaxID=1492771 RepID=UPI002AC9514A|nr:hypothetical protein [Limimaricola variabilis]WPY96293.1 hypothetical protein T8T21_16090 [Limimaricola variabilis]
MTGQTLTHDLAAYATRTRPDFDLIFSMEVNLPAQEQRLVGWFADVLSRHPDATREPALALALRDMVTVRNARLSFRSPPARGGSRPVALIVGDLGGAVPAGYAVAELLRLIGRHKPDIALRLAHDVQQTDARQRAQIAAALQRR